MSELTTELRDLLQEADKGTISVDAVKKAEQIEKPSAQREVKIEAVVLT